MGDRDEFEAMTRRLQQLQSDVTKQHSELVAGLNGTVARLVELAESQLEINQDLVRRIEQIEQRLE